MPGAAGLTGTQQGSIKCLWATATVDIGSTLTLVSTDSSAITVTGARLGDPVILGSDTAFVANYIWTAFVSAADAVKVRFSNGTAATIDPGSVTFTVCVLKLENTAL